MWNLYPRPITATIIAFCTLHPIAAARAVVPCVAPWQVLRAEGQFDRTLDQMWQRSRTFRRQLTKLAAGGLLVTIESCGRTCSQTFRAETTVTYRQGVLAGARVRIRFRPLEEPELIAHELEHVIEQLEGLDLPRLASRGNPGVRVDEGGRYETARAQHIGRLAAAEYRAGLASGCERTTP